MVIKPKFKINDIAYFVYKGQIKEGVVLVRNTMIKEGPWWGPEISISYLIGNNMFDVKENELYKTRLEVGNL